MADGTMVKIKGKLQVILKCGGCKGTISAQVFPNRNKTMISGIHGFQRKTHTLTGFKL